MDIKVVDLPLSLVYFVTCEPYFWAEVESTQYAALIRSMHSVSLQKSLIRETAVYMEQLYRQLTTKSGLEITKRTQTVTSK
jgi:hypothetical protein